MHFGVILIAVCNMKKTRSIFWFIVYSGPNIVQKSGPNIVQKSTLKIAVK